MERRPVPTGDLTDLLAAHARGDAQALDHLFELAYDELRRLASSQRRRAGALTLDTVGLVHDLYLKLARGAGSIGRDREHFLAIAARAMRQLVVDTARRARREKRGGDRLRVTLSRVDAPVELDAEALLALDRALTRLAELEPRLVRVVEMRHFAGLSEAECAEAVGVSVRTVQRDWRAATLWLRRELAGEPPPGEGAS